MCRAIRISVVERRKNTGARYSWEKFKLRQKKGVAVSVQT